MKYRKKQIEVEAWQVGSDEPMPAWVEKIYRGEYGHKRSCFVLQDFGITPITHGTWLVNENGKVNPVGNNDFEQTYKRIEESDGNTCRC